MATKQMQVPELGLKAADQKSVVQVLRTVLADEHLLYIKLRKYHWNVTGPQFFSLHELFEQQYKAIEEIIDEVAERIVQYGADAPGTLQEFQEESRLKEHPGKIPDAHDMVADIVADHEAMVRHLRDDVEVVGEEHEDVGAEDFLTGLLQKHQKQAWMARAMISGKQV
ncbi:MAG: DNA starvation/stationary phase protection protein [Anaerolineae bacterium]|nr:DNA starvation/stationary phase protection protein [Anaerolineae bacterium]